MLTNVPAIVIEFLTIVKYAYSARRLVSIVRVAFFRATYGTIHRDLRASA